MNAYDPSSAAPPHPGDDNVVRLLDQSYDPPAVPAEFADRVRQRMLAVAAVGRISNPSHDSVGRISNPSSTPRRPSIFPRRVAWVAAAAALLASIAAGFQFFSNHRDAGDGSSVRSRSHEDGPGALDRRTTARPRPVTPAVPVLLPGQSLATNAKERRRVQLPDGSALYLNENTAVRCDAERKITLKRGEVFVEVEPRPSSNTDATFVVQTPKRDVTALGTKFIVRADDAGTNVAVTQGKVKVSDFDGVLSAGQQLLADTTKISIAPRASFLLEWARDLMTVAEGVLVPAARFQGGALVVVDPNGQEATLTLRGFHLDVHIEDGYARTTIDQTYFNHLASRQEGTFYFPLPPDASLSRLAMYVDGNLMEGGMVERNEGRAIFESIVRRQKDPALLEWVDGNTFKMRVFPLEGCQEKRIVLSYTQKLNGLYGKAPYRFPGGHSLEEVGKWSFHARIKDGAATAWQCETHTLHATTDKNDLVLDAEARGVHLGRDVVLGLTDVNTGLSALDAAKFAEARHDNARYLQVRLRPDLHHDAKRERRDWLFVVETSAERDPLLARTQIEIVRKLLSQAEHTDTFTVVAASARPQFLTTELRPVTAENIAAAVAFLEKQKLIGALDLERALEAAAPLVKDKKNLHVVHIGCGLTSIGERRPEVLARRIPAGASYIGVAVGKKWNRTFMKLAAEKTGGYLTQINPDEQVAWKVFELYSTLNTPRLLGVKVADADGKLTFLCHSTAVAQGEELCAVARSTEADGPLPEKLIVTGTLGGKDYRRELKVEQIKKDADYLPRTWGRLEVERLIAQGAEQNKAALIALSKSLYVMTPFTSLIVLENDAMYAQYNVDRGRKDHWALYPCPDKIPVVYEPLPGMPGIPTVPAPQTGKTTAEQLIGTIASRQPITLLANPTDGDQKATKDAPIPVNPYGITPYSQYAPGTYYPYFNPYLAPYGRTYSGPTMNYYSMATSGSYSGSSGSGGGGISTLG